MRVRKWYSRARSRNKPNNTLDNISLENLKDPNILCDDDPLSHLQFVDNSMLMVHSSKEEIAI